MSCSLKWNSLCVNPINQDICIVNKYRMRHWLLSKVNGHDNLEIRAERRSCNSSFRLIQVYLRMSKFRLSWLLLGIKWKYSPAKEFVITECKIPEHLGTDSSKVWRWKNVQTVNWVSQSLLVNIPAVTENHRDCDVGKSLKCSLKNGKSSRNYAVY